jgi:hypothetical protein
MLLKIFTDAHVLISLVGIFSGVVVLYGFMTANHFDGWTSLFLCTTVLTSVTGFMFPYEGFKPSYVVGAVSLVVLAIAIFARYRRHMEGGWRTSYVVSSVIALYLNCFVLVVQLFRRVAPLKTLAPTQTEPPFKIAQLVLLLLFVALTVLAVKNFRHAQPRTA